MPCETSCEFSELEVGPEHSGPAVSNGPNRPHAALGWHVFTPEHAPDTPTSPLPGCHGVAGSKWGRTQTRGGCVTAGEEFEPHRDGPNRRERSAPRWYSGKH